MKIAKLLVIPLVILVALILFEGCAAGKYVPKPNEEFYGTWINQNGPPEKIVYTPDGAWKWYLHASDSASFYEGTGAITSKWADSEGNIWYKFLGTYTGGTAASQYIGMTFTELYKLSKNATVWESVLTMPTSDQQLRDPLYPAKIDPKDPHYRIYFRTGN